jgi:hypothetical protein
MPRGCVASSLAFHFFRIETFPLLNLDWYASCRAQEHYSRDGDRFEGCAGEAGGGQGGDQEAREGHG